MMGLEQTVEDVNKAYVGFEITFSNDDLELMRLTKKEFGLNIDKIKKDIVHKIKQLEYDIKELNKIKKKQKKENNVEGEKKTKNDIEKKEQEKKRAEKLKEKELFITSHEIYCKKIREKYHDKWNESALKYNTAEFVLKGVKYVQSKRKETENEDYMMLRFSYMRSNDSAHTYASDKEIVRSEKGELIQWTWYLDVDECCLEVHAPPLTINEYSSEGVGEIIKEHIYKIADRLKLKSGRGGMGGGHLSIDMVTGFDNKPENVLKTVVLWEVLKSKIDKCGKSIDVEDNVNAGYFYDGTRNVLPGILQVTSNKKLELETTWQKIVEWTNDIEKECKNTKQPTDKLSKIFCKTLLDVKNNNINAIDQKTFANFISTLAAFARDNPISEHGKKMTQDEDGKNFKKAILHYHNINLEHVHICDPKKIDLYSDSRVEFRRFVSQTDYYVLLDNIQFLLSLIALARGIDNKLFIKLFYSIPNFVLARTVES